jgi:hypothetical protein
LGVVVSSTIEGCQEEEPSRHGFKRSDREKIRGGGEYFLHFSAKGGESKQPSSQGREGDGKTLPYQEDQIDALFYSSS